MCACGRLVVYLCKQGVSQWRGKFLPYSTHCVATPVAKGEGIKGAQGIYLSLPVKWYLLFSALREWYMIIDSNSQGNTPFTSFSCFKHKKSDYKHPGCVSSCILGFLAGNPRGISARVHSQGLLWLQHHYQ